MSVRAERLERRLALAIGVLPEPVRRRLASAALTRHDGVVLDSRTAVLIASNARNGRAFRSDVTVEQLRRSYAHERRRRIF